METVDLLHRVERLESQNRKLRKWLGLGAIAVLGLLTAAAVQVPTDGKFNELEVRKLVLKHGTGEVAATLTTDEIEGTVLSLLDIEGEEGMRLKVSPRFSEMRLNVDNKPRFQVEAFPESGTTAMRMFNGLEQVVLYGVTEGGLNSLYLMGEPNDKGIRPLIGMTTPPGDHPPTLNARTRDLKNESWPARD